VIPTLLLRQRGLYKTVRFKEPRYVGDPINAVKIFNDKGVDELIILDIEATAHGRGPDFELIESIVSEAFVPICYGGGVATLEQFARLFRLGIEKVALNAAALKTPQLIGEAAAQFGSQSVVISIDVRRTLFNRYEVYGDSGRTRTRRDPVEFAREMQQCGAGELVVCAVEREGTMTGFDLSLTRLVAGAVSIPVIALGGAGTVAHIEEAFAAGASAVAAGSMFVFHGPHRAVLISYPTERELGRLQGQLQQG
jgi:cyclase